MFESKNNSENRGKNGTSSPKMEKHEMNIDIENLYLVERNLKIYFLTDNFRIDFKFKKTKIFLLFMEKF